MNTHWRVTAALLALALSACDSGFQRMAIADAPPPGPQADARTLMRFYGCGDCHTIPGVPGARGRVGPTLEKFAERSIIAGSFPNTSDNLTSFIVAPPTMRPGSAMPVTGISEPQARAVAAYLLDSPRRLRRRRAGGRFTAKSRPLRPACARSPVAKSNYIGSSTGCARRSTSCGPNTAYRARTGS